MATALIERPRQELVTQWQIYFDEELRDVGVRAPAPIVGQSPKKYAAGTCEDLKAHIPAVHPLAQVDFYELQGQALSNFAEQMTRAVKEERNNPLTVEPGSFARSKDWTNTAKSKGSIGLALSTSPNR